MTLDEMLAKLSCSPDSQDIIDQAQKATAHMKWVPNPGPQTEAYFC